MKDHPEDSAPASEGQAEVVQSEPNEAPSDEGVGNKSAPPEKAPTAVSVSTPETKNVREPLFPGGWKRYLPVLGVLGILSWLQFRYFAAVIQHPVFWRDEAAIAAISNLSWGEMLRFFASEWKCYTHQVILKVVFSVFGDSETAARGLSFAAVLGTVWLTYIAVLRWQRSHIGAFLASMLVGTSPVVLMQILPGAQPYALALFTAVLLFERFAALYEMESRFNWLAVGLAALLALNTQPVNIAVAFGLGVLWIRRELFRSLPIKTILFRSSILPGLMMAAALPTLIQTVRFMAVETGTGTVRAGGSVAGLVASVFACHFQHAVYILHDLAAYAADDNLPAAVKSLFTSMPLDMMLLGTVSITVVGFFAVRQAWRRYGLRLVDTFLFAGSVGLFLALAGLGSDRMIIPLKSYSAFALPAMLPFVMLLQPARKACLLLCALMLTRAFFTYGFYEQTHDGAWSNAEEAAEWIAGQAEEEDLILLANTTLSPAFTRYYEGKGIQYHHPYDHAIGYYKMTEMYAMQTSEVFKVRSLERISAAAEDKLRIWFVRGGTPPPLPEHPWFGTDMLPRFEERLAESHQRAEIKQFAGTQEPFTVELWDPKPVVQGEPGAENELDPEMPQLAPGEGEQ